jgi:hypothetical protein
MELHRFFRYAIEKMCKEKKSLNHFVENDSSINRKCFGIFYVSQPRTLRFPTRKHTVPP